MIEPDGATITQRVADRCRRRRAELGLTRGALARRAELPEAVIQRIEDGVDTEGAVYQIDRLARGLCLSLIDLIGAEPLRPLPYVRWSSGM